VRADEKLTAFMELEAAIRPLRQVVLTKQVAGPSQQTVNTHPVRKGGYLSAVLTDVGHFLNDISSFGTGVVFTLGWYKEFERATMTRIGRCRIPFN